MYYMGSDHIVFGSDSLWYGGPQWQVDALWRFQIPDEIAEQVELPAAHRAGQAEDPRAQQRPALRAVRAASAARSGTPGSAYQQGNLASYAALMQPGSPIDTVLQGVGYPTPITPAEAALIPDDNFATLRKLRTESGTGRSNTRFGWMRAT